MTGPERSREAGDGDLPVILVVEDEDDLRTDIVEELEEAGYAVIEARDGAQALAQIAVGQPDLILCDINMPGQSGYDVLHRLREHRPDLADVPFVFLTALGDRREVVEGKRSGADDYLVKPIEFDLLLATIGARLREVRRMQSKANSEFNAVRHGFSAIAEERGAAISDGARQALEFVALGVILLDGNGRLLFANRAARTLAKSKDGLELDTGARASFAANGGQLSKSISDANAHRRRGEDYVASLMLARPSGRRDIMAVVCALNGGDETRADGAAVSVLVSDAETRPTVPDHVLASMFGLTPTEALVAGKLAHGERLDEIADSLGVSQTTIAFHLRNLYQKTNTNRQADLIALVLAGPMAMVLD